jgi:hypothetical protein
LYGSLMLRCSKKRKSILQKISNKNLSTKPKIVAEAGKALYILGKRVI